MQLETIRGEIERMRAQVGRQRKEIRQLQRAGIPPNGSKERGECHSGRPCEGKPESHFANAMACCRSTAVLIFMKAQQLQTFFG
jgi:hypothetical protein